MAITLAQSRKISAEIAKKNPRFKPIIKQSGPCPLGLKTKKPLESNFSTLASSILSQQLSTFSATDTASRVNYPEGIVGTVSCV